MTARALLRCCSALATLALTLASARARAGGYDTPMLYSARHMGMGGSAIGYVRDPSALFHNPAGLANVPRAAALVDVSLLLGTIQGSPAVTARSVTSETTVAPFFLVGGAFRINRWLSAGLGLYPVASAGATYHYGADGFEDKTSLLFVEASPALALNLTKTLRVGAGYRATFVRLERYSGNTNDGSTPFLDFKLAGMSYAGVRLGVQWTATPDLELGAAYRHRTTTHVTNEQGIALRSSYRDISSDFVLPSKLGVGARYDLRRAGLPLAIASDVEYAFNSQNEGSPLQGSPASSSLPSSVPNIFAWQNSVTLRLGLEYRLLRITADPRQSAALRAGYVFDSKVANEKYPTAFGTPPGATHVFTVGGGYDFGALELNAAFAYRAGSASVTNDDLTAPGRKDCAFCGAAGDYRIKLSGIYFDVSYEL